MAQALRKLNASNVAQSLELPVWTLANELEILRDRLSKAQQEQPQWGDRIAAVLAGCEQIAAQISQQNWVTVHRDFYQDQLLERGGRAGEMVLLDLDLTCQGHSALDAGNYIAHIQELALRKYGDIQALSEHYQAFMTNFLMENSHATQDEVDIYTSLSLARHIYISTQFDARKQTTEKLLTLCEQRLASHFLTQNIGK